MCGSCVRNVTPNVVLVVCASGWVVCAGVGVFVMCVSRVCVNEWVRCASTRELCDR